MDLASIINLIASLALLYAKEAPLLAEADAVLRSGDQAALDALLAKVQAENDVVGNE